MLLRVNRIMGLLAILSMLVGLLPMAMMAAPPEDAAAGSGSAARLSPVAIGTIAPGSKHLRAPREDVVELWLRERDAIPLNATPEQIQAATAAYYAKFYKGSSSWVSPAVQARVQEHELALGSGGQAPMAIQPITAMVLAMAVQFGATEAITMPCLTAPVDHHRPDAGRHAAPQRPGQ